MASDAAMAQNLDYAAQIRAIMARLGMGDDEFAHAIKMSPSGLKKIINKPFQTPKAHNIRSINAIAPPELRIRLDPDEPEQNESAPEQPARAMEPSPQAQDRLDRLQRALENWRELSEEERRALLAVFQLTAKP